MRAFFPALALSIFATVPAIASAPLYTVGLQNPPVDARIVVKDMAWTCGGDGCSAVRTGASPDGGVCAAVVRKLGPVTRFGTGLREFDADALAKCNAAAK
jgi:hypothetical protein